MLHLLLKSGKRYDDNRAEDAPAHGSISSFQAFTLSIAARVGTGNMAGVATAIAVGGPGAIFWMWVIALVGASDGEVRPPQGPEPRNGFLEDRPIKERCPGPHSPHLPFHR